MKEKPNLTNMQLCDCPVRQEIKLTDIALPARNVLRMQELGVRSGAHAVVTQHAGFGGLVLNIAGSRVAVDHRSCSLIEAEVV